VTTEPSDPSLTYNFRLKWDGRYVAALLERGIATDREFMEWAGQVWLYRVSEYTALPELDGEANVVAVEQEGWERDTSVTPPPGWPHSP
jgi:hypothetical protein